MATRRSSLLRLLASVLLWLILAGALTVQLRIAAEGGVRLPEFALDLARRRLAEQGFTVQAEAVWLDRSGRVLVLAPRVGLVGGAQPFATARALSVRLDLSAPWHGLLGLRRADISGLEITAPGDLAADGQARTLLSAGEFRLARSDDDAPWRVEQASARVLGVPTDFRGRLPQADKSEPEVDPSIGRPTTRSPATRVAASLRRAIDLHDLAAPFPLTELQMLRVELDDVGLRLTGEVARAMVPPHLNLPADLTGAALDEVALRLDLPFAPPDGETQAMIHLAARSAHLPAARLGMRLEDLRFRLQLADDFQATLVVGSARSDALNLPATPLVLTARTDRDGGRAEARAALRLADTPWTLSAEGEPTTFSGRVIAEGQLTPHLLDCVRVWLPPRARPILQIEDNVALAIGADITAGGHIASITARMRAGRAVAGRVPFDRAAADARFTPDDGRLDVRDLLLVQSDSAATGRYEMDARTLDFRFLLNGALRPMAIEGWFSGWWDRLWDDFAFGAEAPAADVDIQGVWGRPARTTLFIGASSGPMRLRELDLDALHTRVWVDETMVNVAGFRATAAGSEAEGAFARHTLPGHGEWHRLTFNVRSTFPSDALPKLFAEDGAALIAPFRLSAAPRVSLSGETRGPGAGDAAGDQRYELALETDAPLTYQGFPLERLSVRATQTKGELALDDLRVGVAGGSAVGAARLSGPANARWLAFDLNLADAGIDDLQNAWRQFQIARGTQPPTPKPLGGRLDLTLAATGPMADPLAFSGQGSAHLAGAELAAIRLFGPFSTMLGQVGLGFGTVRLHTADATFLLDGSRLALDPLTLTGDAAQVDSRGSYDLAAETINFTARIQPFRNQSGLISGAADWVLTPLSSALTVHLDGALDRPAWRFNYGPRQLLKRITDR